MDKSQADAIAAAILEPDKKARMDMHRKRLAETQGLAKRRKVAWFVLAGALLGLGFAHLTGHRYSAGILWGGLPGAVVGWLFVTWAAAKGRSS